MVRTAPSWKRLGSAVITLALLSLLLPTGSLHGQERAGVGSTPEDSVLALEPARARALLQADTTGLSRLIADDFVEISRVGQLRTKAENLREIASGELKLTSVKYDSLAVRIHGDVAILRGVADNAGSYRGFPFRGKLRYTRIFVRRAGSWQAVAMQHTMIQ